MLGNILMQYTAATHISAFVALKISSI